MQKPLILMSLSVTKPSATDRHELRLPRGGRLDLSRSVPLVMGIVNLTPDSFSDGGLWMEPHRAVDRGLALLEQGADLLDLGAESTRPGGGVYGGGATDVPVSEELRRLIPVLERLRATTQAPISVDTRKAEVAEAALAAGADMINDVSALAEPDLGRAVARSGCPIVLMHSRGALGTMQRDIAFRDVVAEVGAELELALERATELGIERSQIVIDPGIGFGKAPSHNLILLREIPALAAVGPVLIGASRKSFIGSIAGAEIGDRLPGSLASVAWAAQGGASIVRVHDVAETVQFLAVWKSIATETGP